MKQLSIKSLSSLRYGASIMSIVLMLVALVSLGIKGLNWGMDFTGGMVTEVQLSAKLDSRDLNTALDNSMAQEVTLVPAGEPGRWIVRQGEPAPGDASVMEVLSKLDPGTVLLNSSIVGSQVGEEMAEMGGLAVLAALLCILLYLWFRFEWRLACGALFALFHDVILVLGLFSLTQLEFNLTILAAVMAVVGYSLNDSIVIADRIRELLLERKSWPLAKVCDSAVAQTFGRTLVTSGTTLTTVAVLWLFAGPSLHGFAMGLFFGVFCGTWSSVTIGTMIPEWLQLKPEHCMPEPVSDTP